MNRIFALSVLFAGARELHAGTGHSAHGKCHQLAHATELLHRHHETEAPQKHKRSVSCWCSFVAP